MFLRHARWFNLIILLALTLGACTGEKSAEAYLQDGQKYLESGDLSKAIAALEEALKRDPTLAEAQLMIGQALMQLDRWPEAIDHLEVYQTLAPNDAAGYMALGEALALTGKLEQAAEQFSQGIKLDPSYLDNSKEIKNIAESILQAGKEALNAGDLATASQLLNNVATLVSGEGQVFVELGQKQLENNNLVPAMTAYAHALQQSPELADELSTEIDELIQRGLDEGQAAFKAQDLNTAARLLKAVTELAPNDPKAHFYLGNVYNQGNQLAQAIEQYQAVLKLEPDNASARTNLGVVYYKAGQLDTAIQNFQAALQIDPDDAETHYLLGAAYVQSEQYEGAKTEFEAAISLDDQLAPPLIGLGNIYLLQNDVQAALEALEQAIALAPNSPEAHFALAQVYIQMQKGDQARAALEQMLALNPDPYWRQQAEEMLKSLDSQ